MKKFSLYLMAALFLFASSASALTYGREKLKGTSNTQQDFHKNTTTTTGGKVGSGKGMTGGGGTIRAK